MKTLRSVPLLALLGLATAASADLTFATGFDGPDYAPGRLAGQAGWEDSFSTRTDNQPQVSTARPLSGSRSILVERVDSVNPYVRPAASLPFAAGLPSANRYLSASADLYVESLDPERFFGIGFGGIATLGPGTIESVGLGGGGLRGGSRAAQSADGLLQARPDADFVGRWVHLSVVADRSLATDNVTYVFSGLGGATSTATFTRSFDFSSFSDGIAYLQVFSATTGPSTPQGRAYVDNVWAYAGVSPVPEPASFAALGLGAVAALRRRKRA